MTKLTSYRKTYKHNLVFASKKDWSKSNVHAIIVVKFHVYINQQFTVQTKEDSIWF